MQPARGRIVVLAGFVAAYVFFIAWYHAPYAGGSDSSGYLNSARFLLDGRLTAPQAIPATLPPDLLPRNIFHPLGYIPHPHLAELLPTYPLGLPLQFAALGLVFGLGPATTLVALASALGLVGLTYLVAREFGVRPAWATALAAGAALSPLTLLYALQPMSDLVAATWCLLTIFCALRSSRHWAWALAAGGAMAMSVLVRPTNLLLVLPAVVALQPRLRTWLVFIAGGIPGAALLAGYNHALYGRIVTTGYGDVSSLFSWKHVAPTLIHYLTWIPVVASPLVVAACALPFLRLDRRAKAVLFLWAGVLPLFYSAYECTKETWWYLRFILPALPAFGIAAVLVLQQVPFPTLLLVSRILPAGSRPDSLALRRALYLPLTWLLMLATAGWFLTWDRHLRIRHTELDERVYPLVGEWAATNLAPGSLIVAHQVSGALLYYADQPSLNFNAVTPDQSARLLAWADRERQPLHAILFPYEEDTARSILPGNWQLLARIRQASVWRRTGPLPPGQPPP